MKNRTVKVGDVCERIDYGFTASADFSVKEPRLLRITDIQEGNVDWENVPGCTISTDEEKANRLEAGDIVFARTGATTGKSFLIRHAPRAVFASYLIRLRANREVLPEYLAAFCQSEAYWHQINGAIRGAAQGGVNSTTLSSLVLPLPSLSEQQRIARELEKADRLRRTRRYALELSATFLPAAFNEIVGSPSQAAKRWPMAKLDDCCRRITDGTHLTPEFLSEGVPFIFVKNIENGRIDFKTDKFIPKETHNGLYARCPVEKDDILYTIVGATYGQAALVGEFTKFAFQRHIAHLKPERKIILPKFLAIMMQLPIVKLQADRWARGAAQPTINLKELKEYVIPVPPLSLQQQFADLLDRVERLRSVQRESLRQAEHLFASLLNDAFQPQWTS